MKELSKKNSPNHNGENFGAYIGWSYLIMNAWWHIIQVNQASVIVEFRKGWHFKEKHRVENTCRLKN